jgi:hypothetical protein
MALGNRLADQVLIVGAVGGEASHGIGDLLEQSVSHRGIVDILPGHRDATISPLAALTPICSLRQERRRDVPCFSAKHSPAPQSFSPVLSTSKCSEPAPALRSCGTSSVLARRLKVEWSGTARSSPSSPVRELISPSVYRSARPKTTPIVRAVLIARAE